MRPVLLVLLAGACAGSPTPRPEPPEPPMPPTPPSPPEVVEPGPKTVKIHLISAQADLPDASPLGCGESMVPVDVTVTASGPRQELEATVAALLQAEDRDGLSNAARGVFTASVAEKDGALWVDLVGEPTFSGVCAAPRLTGPINATIAPYGATILLNGSDKDWRCLGDESGACP